MGCKLAVKCNLMYGYLKCGLPEDTIKMDLRICTLKGIHTFKKDYKSQSSKCTPWETKMLLIPAYERR